MKRPETIAKMRAAALLRNPIASSYDLAELLAAVRAHDMIRQAADALGISPKALDARLTRLYRAGLLPDDIAARRQRSAAGPRVGRIPRATVPKRRKPAAHVKPRGLPRWVPLGTPTPAPEPYDGPTVVVELPTPVWPAPEAPRPPDAFAARRHQLARERHEQVWRERHSEGAWG